MEKVLLLLLVPVVLPQVDVAAAVEWLLLGVVLIWRHSEE